MTISESKWLGMPYTLRRVAVKACREVYQVDYVRCIVTALGEVQMWDLLDDISVAADTEAHSFQLKDSTPSQFHKILKLQYCLSVTLK